MVEETKGHNKKVEELKGILYSLNLPALPLSTVKSDFYTPDVVTRIDQKFIPIDFINSKERVAIDVGGLCLVYNKDIVERCLAVIDDKLWDSELKGFRRAKMNLPAKLTMIPMREVKSFFETYLS